MTWRFKGQPGEFIPGVPARDLTDEEAEAHPEVRESPLYEREADGLKVAGRKVRKSDG